VNHYKDEHYCQAKNILKANIERSDKDRNILHNENETYDAGNARAVLLSQSG
jgi:hypothetical protein